MREALAGYLAGFFDGEGSVYAATRHGRSDPQNRRPSPTITICISNTNKDVLDLHQELFGGSLFERKGKRQTNSKWRQQWQWVLCSNQAEPYLKAIGQHLLVKKDVVSVALEYIELMKTPVKERRDYSHLVRSKDGKRWFVSPRVRPEFREKIMVLHNRIRELNARGAPFNVLRRRNVFEQAIDNQPSLA